MTSTTEHRPTQLGLVPFGKHLFSSGDLDPVYLALRGINLGRPQLHRWLIAYWYFYDCGFASYASERVRDDFWQLLSTAAINTEPSPVGERWPRGAERRHFRGPKAINAVHGLRKRYGDQPESMVEFVASGRMQINPVIARATTHPMCGAWVGFKIADMVDGVLGERVEQDDITAFLYGTPRQSITSNYEHGVIPPPPNNADKFEFGVAWLAAQLMDYRIPHKPRSAPDWFSLETVFCKHLSHLRGHYPLFHDTVEIAHGLTPWTRVSPTAALFAKHLPTAATGELLMRTKTNGKAVSGEKRLKPTIGDAEYLAAVEEGKQYVGQIASGWWKLGGVLDRITTRYGKGTLKSYIQDIGLKMAACTAERHRDVYRAWKEKYAPGRESSLPAYAVARELAAVGDRAEIVAANPNITKAEAAAIRQQREGKDSIDANTQRWWSWLLKTANEIESDDGLAMKIVSQTGLAETRAEDIKPELLAALQAKTDREALPDIRTAGERLVAAGERLVKLADVLEKVHAPSGAEEQQQAQAA